MSNLEENMTDFEILKESSDDIEETKKCLTYLWRIENFSYCIQQQSESLESPPFNTHTSDEHNWKILLYPAGKEDCNYVALYLQRLSSSTFECDLELSFLATDGTSLRKWEKKSCFCKDEHDDSFGNDVFASKDEVFSINRSIFLPNDILTVCCRIRTVKDIITGQYCARTRVGVNRMSFSWNTEGFSSLLHKTPTTALEFQPNIKFHMSLLLGAKSVTKQKVKVEIKRKSLEHNCFCKCKIDVLDDKGNAYISSQEDIYFQKVPFYCSGEYDTSQFFIDITRDELLSNKKLVVNDVLTMQCVFTCSVGELSVEIDDSQTTRCPFILKRENRKNIPEPFKTVKDDLLCMYKDQKFSDVCLRIGEKLFRVHKNILSARSFTFRDMFENNFKKDLPITTIAIQDVDEETMERILHFLYSNKVEDIGWKDASELYLAANKYRIQALKKICSSILESKLSVSNVFEVLLKSDPHQCLFGLRKVALDFMLDHDTEILKSREWEEFVKIHPHLSINVLRELYLQKHK